MMNKPISDKVMQKAKQLRKEIFRLKSERDKLHSEKKIYQNRMNETNNIVANLIGQSSKLKIERNTLNAEVKSLKHNRNNVGRLMKQSLRSKNAERIASTRSEHHAIHLLLKRKAREAQQVQSKMDDISGQITINKKIASENYTKMMELKGKADSLHAEKMTVTNKYNELKIKHGIDFIEFNEEEE